MLRNKLMTAALCLLGCMMFTLTSASDSYAKKRIVFAGGPAGGTFQVVANAIQVYKPVKDIKDFSVKAQSSAGSVENLRSVDRGKSDFGVVYF